MPDETFQTCAYHVVRYQPNLIRDEWVNVGVLLLIPGESLGNGHEGGTGNGLTSGIGAGRVRLRFLDEPADFLRLRRLHPSVDEELLLRLPAEFDRQFAGREMDAETIVEKFDETLSNAVQLAPRKGLLSRDPDAELDRLFREQVEPVRLARRGTGEARTRSDVRSQAADYFRTGKILHLMQRGVRVAEITRDGDPMRIDFSYRRNGTRGFVQSLALARDPGQAKLLAYTAEAIRKHVKHTEFLAVTEREPARGNPHDKFVSDLLEEKKIRILPLGGELRKWAHDVAPVLRAEGT